MNKDYYVSKYEQYCIRELINQCIINGHWTKEEAPHKAIDEQKEALPSGIETEGHYLFIIKEQKNQKEVGEIWIGEMEKGNEEIGFRKIRLHVFEKNHHAKSLYSQLGYKEYQRRENSIWMEKEIGRKNPHLTTGST